MAPSQLVHLAEALLQLLRAQGDNRDPVVKEDQVAKVVQVARAVREASRDPEDRAVSKAPEVLDKTDHQELNSACLRSHPCLLKTCKLWTADEDQVARVVQVARAVREAKAVKVPRWEAETVSPSEDPRLLDSTLLKMEMRENSREVSKTERMTPSARRDISRSLLPPSVTSQPPIQQLVSFKLPPPPQFTPCN